MAGQHSPGTVLIGPGIVDDRSARLIAAAPEMAELLREVRSFLDHCDYEARLHDKIYALLARIDGGDQPATTPLARYRQLMAEVERIRSQMDAVWLQLTDEERAGLDAPEGT